MPNFKYVLLIILSILMLVAGSIFRIFFGGASYLKSELLQLNNAISKPEESVTFGELYEWIKVEQFDLAPCRDDSGNPSNTFWVLLKVSNNQENIWIHETGGWIEFISADQVVGSFTFSDFSIGPQTVRWFTDPDLLEKQTTIRISNQKIDSVNIRFTAGNVYRPKDVSDSVKLTAELLDFETANEKFPRHDVKFRVSNIGTETIYHARVFAAIYDSAGKLVDLIWSEKPTRWPVGKKLEPNESQVFNLTSVARTGRCLGAADLDGYQLEYWVEGLTYFGMPVFVSYPKQTGIP